jgi:hypothetical protein
MLCWNSAVLPASLIDVCSENGPHVALYQPWQIVPSRDNLQCVVKGQQCSIQQPQYCHQVVLAIRSLLSPSAEQIESVAQDLKSESQMSEPIR